MSKKPFYVPNLSLMNITYEITIRGKYLKTSLRLFFFMLQQTIPLYLACEKALTIKASVRVTSPVNKFETLSNTTRGEGTSCRSANNSNMEPSRADVYSLIDIGWQSNVHIICVNKVEQLPQMQTYFKMFELNSVISNI